MKHVTICIILLILSTVLLSQQSRPAQAFTKEHYLQISKHQRHTAWILAGGGLVLEIAGVIAYQYGNASFLLVGVGLISQIVSIPFFVSAIINKGKSKKASLSFNLKKTRDIHTPGLKSPPQLAISLKVNF
jgi:hypothetical protein